MQLNNGKTDIGIFMAVLSNHYMNRGILMNQKKRALALLLAFCMPAVPACSEKAADAADGSAKTSSEITAPTVENEEVPDVSEEPDPLADALPEKDMGGWTFRMSIFVNGAIRAETYAEEMNGNVVNDAVYT